MKSDVALNTQNIICPIENSFVLAGKTTELLKQIEIIS
jgi:hypothetical protein